MIRIGLLLGLLVACSPAAHAQTPAPLPLPIPPFIDTRGTPEDQRACTPDARRLCREVIESDMAVLQCFQRQRERLSPACRAVLQKYGQ
jgi:hypothetical protein